MLEATKQSIHQQDHAMVAKLRFLATRVAQPIAYMGRVMDPVHKVVTEMPLTELWNGSGPLVAIRGENLGQSDIAQLLRNGSSFVVADMGSPLRWISGNDRFAFWKAEVKCRLVPPDTDGFQLDDYPDSYCYVAAVWRLAFNAAVIVLEKRH